MHWECSFEREEMLRRCGWGREDINHIKVGDDLGSLESGQGGISSHKLFYNNVLLGDTLLWGIDNSRERN